ncbi:MAG: hypothetical protein ACRCYS_07555 [Beijerinckiaceae bacterium]
MPVKNGTNTASAFEAQKGKGRPKGAVNKQTAAIKDMIVTALDGAGGAAYLQRQAEENPGPFMALVGKVLPLQLNGSGEGGSHRIVIETGVSRKED